MFCTQCGEELSEKANFCPKCGTRTSKGKAANIPLPREAWREAFAEVGEELNKAFSVASKEIEKAFIMAKEEIRKATTKELVACPNCGEKNAANALFCNKCGKKIH